MHFFDSAGFRLSQLLLLQKVLLGLWHSVKEKIKGFRPGVLLFSELLFLVSPSFVFSNNFDFSTGVVHFHLFSCRTGWESFRVIVIIIYNCLYV